MQTIKLNLCIFRITTSYISNCIYYKRLRSITVDNSSLKIDYTFFWLVNNSCTKKYIKL